MNVRVLEREPTLVACRRYIGPPGAPLLEFWTNEVYPWMVTLGLDGQTRYGISLDDPSITAPEKFRYDACVELPPGLAQPEDTLTTTIPGGKYAVLRFEGTVEEVEASWAALLRDWLPQSGLKLDARPRFEHYPPDTTYDSKTGVFDCNLCIPVAPL